MLRLKTTFEHQIRTIVTRPKNALPFLQAGRLVRLTPPGGKPLWAVIVNFQRAAMDGADEDDGPALKRRKSSAYRIDVLANAQETKRNIPLTCDRWEMGPEQSKASRQGQAWCNRAGAGGGRAIRPACRSTTFLSGG